MSDTYEPVRQAFLAWQRTQPQQPLFFEIDAAAVSSEAVAPAVEPPTPLGGSLRGTLPNPNQEAEGK